MYKRQALDNGNTLFIQTCDSGYDYTLYGPDNKALDGGQLDAPGLTLPDAGQEALNLLGQTAAVSEVLLGDKLAAFQAVSYTHLDVYKRQPLRSSAAASGTTR